MASPVPKEAAAPLGGKPVVSVKEVTHHYGKVVALDKISIDIPSGIMVGIVGPDGVGKSTLMGLLAGSKKLQDGQMMVLDGDIADASHRAEVCPRIAYMPQGLGKNLYLELSVGDNVDFMAQLFGLGPEERPLKVKELLEATGLGPFQGRPAGKLSGGMKQKVGLCGALVHDPDLLVLDEPTTGVDPLSRRQFWSLIDNIRASRPGMSVVISTAYMDEAQAWDWIVAMDAGRVLATGSPAELMKRTSSDASSRSCPKRSAADTPSSRSPRVRPGPRRSRSRPTSSPAASAISPPSIASPCRSSAARSSASSARTAAASRRR